MIRGRVAHPAFALMLPPLRAVAAPSRLHSCDLHRPFLPPFFSLFPSPRCRVVSVRGGMLAQTGQGPSQPAPQPAGSGGGGSQAANGTSSHPQVIQVAAKPIYMPADESSSGGGGPRSYIITQTPPQCTPAQQQQQPQQQKNKPTNLAISVPLAQQQNPHLQKQHAQQSQHHPPLTTAQLSQQHHQQHPHPPQPGSPMKEQSLSGSIYSDDGDGDGGPGNQPNQPQQQGYNAASVPGLHQDDDLGDDDDDSSSDDDSPRENRVLTFADEHGKNLCHVHWYLPDPGEDLRGGPPPPPAAGTRTNDADVDGSLEVNGCGGKCVIL